MDDQAYGASAHAFQCMKSCVTAKPSRPLQLHFRILHCQSQVLFWLLLGVTYACKVLHIPGHFKELQLFTSFHHFSCCAGLGLKCIFNASRNPEAQQNKPGRGIYRFIYHLLCWPEKERITDGSCVAQRCVGGCLNTFECTYLCRMTILPSR